LCLTNPDFWYRLMRVPRGEDGFGTKKPRKPAGLIAREIGKSLGVSLLGCLFAAACAHADTFGIFLSSFLLRSFAFLVPFLDHRQCLLIPLGS
jgi:hypothetical protein